MNKIQRKRILKNGNKILIKKFTKENDVMYLQMSYEESMIKEKCINTFATNYYSTEFLRLQKFYMIITER